MKPPSLDLALSTFLSTTKQMPKLNERTTPRLPRHIALSRLNIFFSPDTEWKELGLSAQLWRYRTDSESHIHFSAYSVPDLKRIPFNEAIVNEFTRVKKGWSFGPSWSTHWVHVYITIPSDWAGEEVQLQWDANCEGLIFSTDGVPLQGLTGGRDQARHQFLITHFALPGQKFEYYIELAANGMFGVGSTGMVPDPNRYFYLQTADLVVPNKRAWALYHDFEIIRSFIHDTPENTQRQHDALYAANEIVNAFKPGDDNSIERGLSIASEWLRKRGGDGQHRVTAIGNCHIDTAWLWPFAETKRKVARSWSSQIRLMDRYPDYKFACSQVQQYEYLLENYPTLFEQVKDKIRVGQFIPIGGLLGSPNLSSNTHHIIKFYCRAGSRVQTYLMYFPFENSAHQFTNSLPFGCPRYQHAFRRGSHPSDAPRTATIHVPHCPPEHPHPSANVSSRNTLTNASRPTGCQIHSYQSIPSDHLLLDRYQWVQGARASKSSQHVSARYTVRLEKSSLHQVKYVYCAEIRPNELQACHGDGGGGPNGEMLERLERLRNVVSQSINELMFSDGLPTVRSGDPTEFFQRVERYSKPLSSYRGELYAEFHRGTYTTQALVKRGNRKNELLLRDVEMLGTLAAQRDPKGYRNQFHDCLPGSSIGMVYDDIHKASKLCHSCGNRAHREVASKAFVLRHEALSRILGLSSNQYSDEKGLVVFNTLAWDRTEVIEVPIEDGMPQLQQYSATKNSGYTLADKVSGMGQTSYTLDRKIDVEPVSIETTASGSFVLRNQYLQAIFDDKGHLINLFDRAQERELVPEGRRGNVFQLYEDIVSINKGAFSVTQVIVLTAVSKRIDFETEAEWHENRQFLATYEIQFGALTRPTHYNTTLDSAKFEVCGHKFADLSEASYGVALLNDCKYGYATHDNVQRLSLLRAPK
ncbi:hypothetical protein BC938DRAFT_471724, partial [Jimgerdemannia flammicorona]